MGTDPCSAIAQIEHIALATSDVERLRDFYVRLGGLASATVTDPVAGARRCALDFCGIRLELVEQPPDEDRASRTERPRALAQLGFVLDSADAVDLLTGALAAAGHRVLEPPHRARASGRYESLVLDPDGNRVTLTV